MLQDLVTHRACALKKAFSCRKHTPASCSKGGSAIRWIDLYLVAARNAIDFPDNNTHPLDTDLSGG